MKSLRDHYREFRASPLWLRMLLCMSSISFSVAILAQTILFPDNPISLKGEGYVGKYGAVHTKAEFETYTFINRLSLLSAVVTFVGIFCAIVVDSGLKKDKGSANIP